MISPAHEVNRFGLTPVISFVFLALFAPHFSNAAVKSTESGDRPNIVFILADDWGWGDLGCYGNKRIKTPHLDQLAEQGMLFTQFYVSSPVCSPSRTAFMTGQFPAHHRIHGHLATKERNSQRSMPNFLDPNVHTVSRLLQTSGYATGHYGKWHLGHSDDAPKPAAYGFDKYRVADRYGDGRDLWDVKYRAQSTELIIDDTISFIEKHKTGPFYVQAWLLDTHGTLNPTPAQMKPYNHLSPRGIDYKSAYQVYYAAATDSDRHIGRLLKKLDELQLTENTLVIFSSDNGPEDILIGNASHSGVGNPGPFRGRKRSLYEGGVRVPFIVRWPRRIKANSVNESTVLSAVDFLPTLCQLANTPVPVGWRLDGEDLSAAFSDRYKKRGKTLMWEWRYLIHGHPWNQSPMMAIRKDKWKLLTNPDGSRVELYDIPADSMELTNLASRHQQVVDELSAQVLRWQTSLPAGPVHPLAGQVNIPWPQSEKSPQQ